jgi:hypothetical protein
VDADGGDQGVMSLGEGHGDHWSLVECRRRRPRGHVTVDPERDMGSLAVWHLKSVD